MMAEQSLEPYGAPEQVHSDEDVRICSGTGFNKRVLIFQVTTAVPYTHTSNPLCEGQNRVVEQNLRIPIKQESTKDWVRLVPWPVLTMKSQRSSSTAFTLDELFHGGRRAWFFSTSSSEDFKSSIGDWLKQQSMANQAGTNLIHVRERELSRRNRLWPGVAGRSRSPSPSTHNHAAHPGQEWRGTSGAGTRTHTHPSTQARSGGAQPKTEPKHNSDPNTNSTQQ